MKEQVKSRLYRKLYSETKTRTITMFIADTMMKNLEMRTVEIDSRLIASPHCNSIQNMQ